jgi:hypothetical protein
VSFNPQASLAERQQAVGGLIQQLSHDTAPIIVGPWRSEVGFEALYWLPFLRFCATRISAFTKRSVVVSRGGAGCLYAGLGGRIMDLYGFRAVKEVRRENLFDLQVLHGGKTIKQLQETDWDRAVCEDVAKELNLGPVYHTLHPSWMYWALAPYWEEEASLKYLTSLADYVPLEKPALPDGCPVPPKYAAVKFYGRTTFPYPHPDTAGLIQQITATVAAQIPVVVLGSGNEYDDHIDAVVRGPNITALPPCDDPAQNLAIQAAVIAHSSAFVGTYGGMAQLALRMGIPSASFYAEWGGTSHAHLCVSSWLSKAMKVPFVVGNFADVGIWRQLTSVPASVLSQQAPQPEGVTA